MGNKSWSETLFFINKGTNDIKPPCGGPFPDAYDSVTRTSSFVRTGQNIPNWKSLISRSLNASSSMTVTVLKYEDLRPAALTLAINAFPHLTCPTYNQTFEGHSSWNTPIASVVNPSDSGFEKKLLDAASRKLFRILEKYDHQFQGGVFLGEFGKSIKMLMSPMSALKRGMSDYLAALKNRKRGRQTRSTLRRILSDTWLEYAFGWSPLINDMQDLGKSIARMQFKLDEQQLIRLQMKDEFINNPLQTLFPFSAWRLRRQEREVYEFTVAYLGSLKHLPIASEAGREPMSRMQRMLGFDIRSFAPTAWELLPWSFLADYFTNIGDIIQAYSVDTSSVRWLNRVEIRVSKRIWSVDADPAFPTHGWAAGDFRGATVNGGRGTGIHKNIIRWVNPSLPYPGLRFTLDLNWKQIVNISALLAGSRGVVPYY